MTKNKTFPFRATPSLQQLTVDIPYQGWRAEEPKTPTGVSNFVYP